jgi:dienelactone hydrolase
MQYRVVIIAAAACAGGAHGQSSLHFSLAPGTYVAGFRAVSLWDATRTLGGGPRPLQVSIWYPAMPSTSARRMRFREYVWLTTMPGRLPRQGNAAHLAAESLFVRAYADSSDSARVERELDAPTAAVAGAMPAPGRFPVIIYGPGRDGLSYDNSVLCEYLASYGYLVIASPSWGPDGPMPDDFEGIETQARDMEFLLGYARSLAQADTNRVAVMGYSWGGISNVLVAMRNTSVRAVVALDGSIRYWYDRRMKGEPFVHPDRFTVPVLFLLQGNPFPSMDPKETAIYGADTVFTFLDALQYADAYVVTLTDLHHRNFSSLRDKFGAVTTGYDQVARYTRAFLDAQLGASRAALDSLAGAPADSTVTIARRVGRK